MRYISAIIITLLISLSLNANNANGKDYYKDIDANIEKLRLKVELEEWNMKEDLQYTEEYPIRAISIADSLLDMQLDEPRRSEVTYLKTRFLIFLSKYYYSTLNKTKSFEIYNAIDSISESELKKTESITNELKHDYENYQLLAKGNKGYIYFLWRQTKEAFSIIEETISLSKERNNIEFEGRSYRKLADMYDLMGNYTNAKVYYEKAIELFRELDQMRDISMACLMGLGNINYKIGLYREAASVFEEIIEKYSEYGLKRGEVIAHNNLGYSYYKTEEYSKAIDEIIKSIELYKELVYPVRLTLALETLATIYVKIGKYNEASKISEEMLDLCKQRNSNIGIERAQNIQIMIYLLQAKASGELQNEDKYMNKILNNCWYNLFSNFANSYSLQSYSLLQTIIVADSINANLKDFSKYDSPELRIQEELYRIEGEDIINKILQEREVVMQKKTIAMQRKQLNTAELRNVLFIIITLTVLILIFVVLLANRRKKKANQELATKNTLIELQQKEITAQMNEMKKLLIFKERMTNMIIHDLKTPLNGMLNTIHIDDQILKDEIIMHTSSEMMNLVQNLLDFYKAQETEFKITRISTNLAKVISTEQYNIKFIVDEKKLKFITEGIDIPQIYVDKSVIRRVISNLFSNAAKYSPQKGIISIKIEVENNTDLKIFITNQGPEISEDKMDIIFEPFGQLDDSIDFGYTSSTGLGLAFCRMAVEAHGGKIGAIKNLKNGAGFWFTLPNCIINE